MATEQTESGKAERAPRREETMIDFARRMLETEKEAVAEKDYAYLASLAPISVLQEIGVAYMSILLARVNSRPALTEEELKARRERRDQQREEAQKRETEAAEKAVVAVRNSLAAVDANFKMPDGRRLGDWTIGEIRKLGGVFTIILAKAGTKDDARTVDVVMTRNDWKRVKL